MPGWVDVHTHYDGQVSWDSLIAPSSWQGVTTAVMGNCGVGFAPVLPDRHDWLIELMEGVEDIPGTALHEGISWEWESFPEYLDAIAESSFALDIGAQVPHAALRGFVMGDRGGDYTAIPSADEITRMGELAAEGIRARRAWFLHVAHGEPQVEERRLHAHAHGVVRRAARDRARHRCDRSGRVRARRRSRRPRCRVRAHPVDGGGQRATGVADRPAEVRRRGPTEYRRVLDLISAAQADGVPMHGQVPTRPVGLDHEPRQPDAPVRRVAHVPEARGDVAAARSRPDWPIRNCAAQVVAEADAARERQPARSRSVTRSRSERPLRYNPEPGRRRAAGRGAYRSLGVRRRPRRDDHRTGRRFGRAVPARHELRRREPRRDPRRCSSTRTPSPGSATPARTAR